MPIIIILAVAVLILALVCFRQHKTHGAIIWSKTEAGSTLLSLEVDGDVRMIPKMRVVRLRVAKTVIDE